MSLLITITRSFHESSGALTTSRSPVFLIRGDSERTTMMYRRGVELSRNVLVSIGHPMSGYPQNLAGGRPRSLTHKAAISPSAVLCRDRNRVANCVRPTRCTTAKTHANSIRLSDDSTDKAQRLSKYTPRIGSIRGISFSYRRHNLSLTPQSSLARYAPPSLMRANMVASPSFHLKRKRDIAHTRIISS